MFISLSASYVSYACAVKQSIDNYYKKNETQFFDWLVCSMESVNDILEGKPILFEEKSVNEYLPNNRSINFKNFNLLVSYHDINEFTDNSVNELTEKYNRRYERFIDTIKKESTIYFIRYCNNQNNIDEYQIYRFYENIIKINKNLIFKFILVSDDDKLEISNNLKNLNNFIYININDHIEEVMERQTLDFFNIIKKYKCIYNIVK